MLASGMSCDIFDCGGGAPESQAIIAQMNGRVRAIIFIMAGVDFNINLFSRTTQTYEHVLDFQFYGISQNTRVFVSVSKIL